MHKLRQKVMMAVCLLAIQGAVVSTACGEPVVANEKKDDIAVWYRASNSSAKPSDAVFTDYKLRNGEVLKQLKLHYATLGEPHRNSQGEIDNAVMLLHWTGAT